MGRAIAVLVGGLVLFHAVAAPAQNAVLTEEYGAGVHAFFACDFNKAYDQLTAAIDGGSKDPRAFYFRGLAYLKLGRPTEAAADFRAGADLESGDVNKFYNVGKSLERVQGAGRLEVEKYRAAARLVAYQQAERIRKARYEALQREESRVLREQSQGAPEGKAVEPPPEPGDNPFGPAAPPEAKKPAAPSAEPDPFAPAAEKPKAEKPVTSRKGGLMGSIGRAIGKGVAGDEGKPAAGGT
ncbi:MAG: hypothetical protein ABFC96_14665, partial [Thermoguttaceae bacterium]